MLSVAHTACKRMQKCFTGGGPHEGFVRFIQLVAAVLALHGMNGGELAPAHAGTVVVSWDTNTEPDLAGYKVYYGRSSGNYGTSNGGDVVDVKLARERTLNLQDNFTYYFVVTAYDTAGNESAFSTEVSTTLGQVDKTPPALTSVRAVNQAEVEVKFSEPVSAASATNKSNYTIDQGITVNQATLQSDNLTVLLSTSNHTPDRTYTLTVRNIADRATTPNIMSQSGQLSYQLSGIDALPPSLIFASAINEALVDLRFDEPIERASAEKLANYQIDQGIGIQSLVLHTDEKGVELRTSRHTDGGTYRVTVQNLADKASPPNVMTTPASFTYTYQLNDTQAPRAISVTAVDLTTLTLLISERISRESAENVANYQISSGIQVLSARLDQDGAEVILTTTQHLYDFDYNLTVSGLVDASTNANLMASSQTLPYLIEMPPGGTNGGQLTIEQWSPARYLIDTLKVGKQYYVDRNHSVTAVPKRLNGLLMIRTAYRDRRDSLETSVEFNLNRNAEIYVAYDSRVQRVPNWLSTNFSRTAEKIAVSGPQQQMEVWKARMLPGRVRLGGNMAEGTKHNVALSMYFVLIKDLEGQISGNDGDEIPKDFVLHQNYPNPFSLSSPNPHTEVRFDVREENHVVLTIYNMLGQEVRKLYDGMASPGTHAVVWNGRDNDGRKMPSGKYLCILDARAELSNGVVEVTTTLNRQSRVLTMLR